MVRGKRLRVPMEQLPPWTHLWLSHKVGLLPIQILCTPISTPLPQQHPVPAGTHPTASQSQRVDTHRKVHHHIPHPETSPSQALAALRPGCSSPPGCTLQALGSSGTLGAQRCHQHHLLLRGGKCRGNCVCLALLTTAAIGLCWLQAEQGHSEDGKTNTQLKSFLDLMKYLRG